MRALQCRRVTTIAIEIFQEEVATRSSGLRNPDPISAIGYETIMHGRGNLVTNQSM